MKKLFILVIALLAISAPAFANLVVNGDFATGTEAGWTRWQAPRGTGGWDASSGMGVLQTSSQTSFGWYQAVTVTAGTTYTYDAMFQGDGNLDWIEFLVFNDDGRTPYDQLDAPLNSSIIAKVDGWGLNGPQPFGPTSVLNKYFPSGPKTNQIVATGSTIYIGLKAGTAGTGVAAGFDDVQLNAVPEPCSILALVAGLGGLVIRRRK